MLGATRGLVVRTEGGTTAQRGDRVHVEVAGAVHVFEADGARLAANP